MRHEDEFNSSSYIPPKGDSFEFGSVFARNETGIRKENAAHSSDLNSTATNNDSVRAQRSKKIFRKDNEHLDSKQAQKLTNSAPNGAGVTASSASAAGGVSAASVAVQVAAIATATTIVVAGAAGLRTLIHPEASFGELFVTAHTITYQANIDDAEEGEFSIHIYGGTYEDYQEALPGTENNGTFEGLELGKTYTLEIVQSEEGAESAILSSARVTTANYNKFNAFDFDGVADFDEGYFDITLDYIDEGNVYSDFKFELTDTYSHVKRTFALDKTLDKQTLFFNEGVTDSSSDYFNPRNTIYDYSMSYVSKEKGEEETITYKEGKLLFMDKNTPTLTSFKHADYVSLDSEFPVNIEVDDPSDLVMYASLEFSKEGYSPVTAPVDYFKNGWQKVLLSDIENDIDLFNGEVTVKVIGSMNNDMFYIPESTEGLDYYKLPYKEVRPNEGTVVLGEQKLNLTKKAMTALLGLTIYGNDITDGAINCYPSYIDDEEKLSDLKCIIECNGKTHTYEMELGSERLYLESDLSSNMAFEETYADLIKFPSTLHLEATEAGKNEKLISSPQKVQFERSSNPELDSYDFFGFTTDGENIFASFDLHDPYNAVPEITIKLVPLDGGSDAQEAVVYVREVGDGIEKEKHTLPLENLTFDITSTHVRVEIYLKMYSMGDYVDVLAESIDNVLFRLGPAIKNVELSTYIPVQSNTITGRFFVFEPEYLSSQKTYLSNLEVELIHPYGQTIRTKAGEPMMIDQMLCYPFSFDLSNSDFNVDNGGGIKYAIYADNSFGDEVSKGELMKKEDTGGIAVSNCTGVYVSKNPDVTNDGAEAFARVYVHGYNDASFFYSLKFVSSEAGVDAYEASADFYNYIDIPIANLSASPEAGKKVNVTLIGNDEYELATFELTFQ